MDTIVKEYGGILTAILCATVGFSIFALCIVFFGGNSKQMVSEMTGVQSGAYNVDNDGGGDSLINCRHDYGAWTIEKQPTCTEQGTRCRICKNCGNKETGVVAKTKHNYSEEYIIDVKPICIKAGSKSQHCSICGAKRNITTIEKLGEAGHNLEWAIDKQATCIEEGVKSQYCSYCNARRNKTVIPIDLINGHKYGDFVVDTKPTCILLGVKSKHCSLCDNRSEITSIPYGDHVSIVSNYTCGTCGGSFSYNAYAKHTRTVRNSCSTTERYVSSTQSCTACGGSGCVSHRYVCGTYVDTGERRIGIWGGVEVVAIVWECSNPNCHSGAVGGNYGGSYHYKEEISGCGACHGSGTESIYSTRTCSKCNGNGYYYRYPTCYGAMTAHHKCSVCSIQLD